MPDNDVDTGASEPSWYWDDNTPGTGDRPDYLPEKFRSVADAAKSYVQLEKKLGSAPSEYDLARGSDWFESDFEPFQELLGAAKDKHIPQEFMDKMLEATGKYVKELVPDLNAEREKLGENAKERVEKLENWAKSNLSESAFNALTRDVSTAEGLMALEELRNITMSNESRIPGNDGQTGNAELSVDDVREEIRNNYNKYKTDAKYRREIEAKLSRAGANSGYIDKTAI